MRCGLDNWRAVALMSAALMLGSCASTEKTAWVELRAEHMATKPMVQITGTVFRSDLKGGLYLIRNAEGTNYNPTNLPDAFWVDGLAIEATAQRRDDLVSIGMVGSLVDLVRIRVRPDSTAFVSGTVNYPECLALPPDAVVDVQLLDVSRQDAPATIVAGASVPTHERQVPIPFKLAFDPGKILEKHTYAVRAVIRSEGAVVFTTSTRYPVITRGNPSHADLMLVRVGGMKSYTARVSETSWVLENLAGAGVVDGCRRRWCSPRTARYGAMPPATSSAARSLAALREAERFEVKGEFLHIHVAGQSQPLRFIGARDKQGDR